jgi:hypothetical protein
MRRNLILALLGAIALIGSSCGDLKSGDINAPGFSEPTEVAFAFTGKVSQATTGDSVFIGGSFVRSWTPVHYDALEYFGTVALDGAISGVYTRLVWAVSERYTVILWRKGADGRLYPITEELVANGTPLTALSWTVHAIFWEFAVGRDMNGAVVIDPLRDDRWRFVDESVWTDGIASTHPDSLYLNDPVSSTTPIYALSAWTGMRYLPCEWASNRWSQQMHFVRPGTYYVAFVKESGAQVYAGCRLGSLSLNHVENAGTPEHPWWVFAVTVAENGTISNAGPPNLPGLVTIGP